MTERPKVKHRQLYKMGAFGGVINTTYCGRVRNSRNYNIAEPMEEVTCLYCKKIIALKGEPKSLTPGKEF